MDLTPVVRQLEDERTRISATLANVTKAIAVLKGSSPLKAIAAVKDGSPVRKRRLSPAAIARIRAGQKARWAKFRKSKKNR